MICIIPARSGSITIKNKNIKKLGKKPLIEFTIDQAKKSKKISRIVLSTDDNKIIKRYKSDKKIEIPFIRPKNLSGSNSSSIDVYLHCIKKLSIHKKIKNFCVLLPTSPIRKVSDIDASINIYQKKKLDFLVSVCETKPIEFHFNLDKLNRMKKIKNHNFSIKNRQKLNKFYHLNGSIYLLNYQKLKKYRTFMTSKTYCYVMDKKHSIDIDDMIDFNIAKKIIF